MKKRLIYLVSFIGIMIVMITGCSKKSDSTSENNSMQIGTSPQMSSDESEAEFGSTTTANDSGSERPKGNEDSVTNTSAITTNETIINSQDKIIRRINLEIETQDFDQLIKNVDTQINQLGGYAESSSISGRYYYSNNLRSGNIVARVPKDKVDVFINTVKDMANVVNKQESTENVTLQYVDTQSHKEALEIEQERLLALLEKVETLEDIITLETRLSSVRYELQSYESQLRTYDNLVEYSTVTLHIQEVERMSVVSEEKKTVWNRIQTGFGDTIYNISEGFENFLVWFIINLPYLLIWAVIIIIVVLISKKYYKRSKQKNILSQPTVINEKDSNDNTKK